MIEASKLQTILLSAQLGGLWILFLGGLVILPCELADSPFPAFAFAVTWGPNGLFLVLFMRGALSLPRFLVSVHPAEPALYRRVGVGFVKRVVATRLWPLMHGWKPAPKPRNRWELLERTESSTIGAEVCHGAAFIFGLVVTLFFLAAGQFPEAAWIIAYNILLNGYPVMLQRVNRWRVQQIRALTCESA